MTKKNCCLEARVACLEDDLARQSQDLKELTAAMKQTMRCVVDLLDDRKPQGNYCKKTRIKPHVRGVITGSTGTCCKKKKGGCKKAASVCSGNLTIKDAARIALENYHGGQASTRQITDTILNRRIYHFMGTTPNRTVSAVISQSISNGEGIFRREENGKVTLLD